MLKNSPFLLQGTAYPDRACLLLHGLGGGVYEMQLLGEHLHEQGLTVQGINYPGHDRPAPRMPASTWKEWYLHILETYQKLSRRYPSVSVIGFSTGCPLALHLAAANPIENLVLLSPYMAIRHYPYYLFKPEQYLFSIGRYIEDLPRLRLSIRDPIMRQAAEEVAFFRTFNLSAVRSANELIDLVKTELSQVETPTLILQSLKDSVVDPPGAEYLYQHLAAKTKQLVWLKESDHNITLDLEREQVTAYITKFLGL